MLFRNMEGFKTSVWRIPKTIHDGNISIWSFAKPKGQTVTLMGKRESQPFAFIYMYVAYMMYYITTRKTRGMPSMRTYCRNKVFWYRRRRPRRYVHHNSRLSLYLQLYSAKYPQLTAHSSPEGARQEFLWRVPNHNLWPLLIIWIYLNPSMDR